MNLVCHYCGSALSVELETHGAWESYQTVESIECENWKCSTVWEPNGVLRRLPIWEIHPNIYTKP